MSILESGSLGFFWPSDGSIPDFESEPERGYVHTDGGWVVVELLEEDPERNWPSADIEPPEAIVAVMPDDAVVFLEVVGPSSSRRFGAPRASSNRYQARTVIGGTDVTRLRSVLPLALHAHMHGVSRWAGLTAARETHERTSEGRVRAWTVRLEGAGELRTNLPGGRIIVLSTPWRVEGPADRRVLSVPVSIGCEATKPTDAWKLLEPILHVQNLINLAFGGFVAAEGGTSALEFHSLADAGPGEKPWLWNGALMVALPGVVAPKSMSQFPMFDLQTLGGVDALRRWIRLSHDHPRAFAPVVNPYRYGATSEAVGLMEAAAGIEYWVKSNRPAAWTSVKKFAQALASRVGSSFGQWVGDPDAWGTAFWHTNNSLKHEPSYEPDHQELADLAASGRFLLGAALLDRVAGSKAASRAVFKHHRLYPLGARLRGRYG